MNFSSFNYNPCNKSLKNNMEDYYTDKTNSYYPSESLNYREDINNYKIKKKNNDNCNNNNEIALMATKGIFTGINNDKIDPVTELFFSPENIKRLQKMIRRELLIRTNGCYKLQTDQDEMSLIIVMRAVLLNMYGGRFLPSKIKHQVKELNKKVINYIMPDMISQIKQQYGYLREINEPLKPIMRPLNVNNAGRKTLPSITTIWNI